MIILSDSREQKPLDFDSPYIESVEEGPLTIPGTRYSFDYGVRFRDGHIPAIFFERKSLNDLFGTMGTGHDRFKKKILAAKNANVRFMIIVEGTLSRVEDYTNKYTTIAGQTIIKKLFTFWIKYGILTVFTKDRREMANYITNFYVAVGKEYLRTQGKRRL
jgi:ERCC4-type nuclease